MTDQCTPTKDNLSANTLFHFTNKTNLISILQECKFIPAYSVETSPLFDEPKMVPMVCFCDILLSQINSHIEKYGHYGIGLTKEWGIKNSLSPVVYVSSAPPENQFVRPSESALSKQLKELERLIWDIRTNHGNDWEIIEPLLEKWEFVSCFYKDYENYPFRDYEFQNQKRRFYDEREWRYVPQLLSEDQMRDCYENIDPKLFVSPTITPETKIDEKSVEFLKSDNRRITKDNAQCRFTWKDIRYIVVKSEKEITEIIDTLCAMPANQIPDDAKKDRKAYLLKNIHVFSTERLFEDF
jgi:hypothetical protein